MDLLKLWLENKTKSIFTLFCALPNEKHTTANTVYTMQIYSLTAESNVMSKYVYRTTSLSTSLLCSEEFMCVCVCLDDCDVRARNTSSLSTPKQLPEIPSSPPGTVSSSQSGLMAGYIVTHTCTHAETNNSRIAKGQKGTDIKSRSDG